MSTFINIGRKLLITSIFRLQCVSQFKLKPGYTRSIHSSTGLFIKMYMEKENEYAYSVLENKGYAINIYTKHSSEAISQEEFQRLNKEDWTKKTTQEIFEIFPIFGKYCSQHSLCISSEIFDNFIDNLTDTIQMATDSQLKTLFYSLNMWPETASIRTRNYIEVWAALDDECLKRLKNWSHDEMLSFISLFFMLNVTRVSDFSWKSINKLATKANQLTPGQLVQTLFFVGVLRKQPHDMHNLEIHFSKNFACFSVEDIGIMSMGFFKSKCPIRSMELASKIINKVIEDSEHVHEVALAAILKIIRYSVKQNKNNEIFSLLDVLQHQVTRLSVMCNVHLALVGTSSLTVHNDCLTKIAHYIMDHMHETRLKDLERLIFTYGTFNLIPATKDNFFSKVIEELKKPERFPEISQHGKSYSCCISFFGLVGIYPVDLISKALSPEFIENTYGKHMFSYGKELLSLHNSAEIFCRESAMNRLSEKAVLLLSKKYTDYVPSENYKKQYNISEKMMLDIMKVLGDCRGGQNYVIAEHILTHHQRGDIIICNDHNGKPMPVKEAFKNDTFGYIRKPPDDNDWIVLIIGGKNSLIQNCNVPTGQFQTKIRELAALGYTPILVPWKTYSQLDNFEEKESYLCSLIENRSRKNHSCTDTVFNSLHSHNS